jgi:hypothetical protein
MFSTSHLRLGGVVLAAAGLAAGALTAVVVATPGGQQPGRAGAHRAVSADADRSGRSGCAGPQNAPCTAIVRTEGIHRTGVQATLPAGYAPADLQSAYNLAAASAADGSGATLAVIGSYYDASAASDLSVYRAQYGLPPCTAASGCFTQLDEDGWASPPAPTVPAADDSLLTSQAIDLDMVSAVCPNCKIDLLETVSTSAVDMAVAVDSAATLGAKYIIAGWSDYVGGSGLTPYISSSYDHPGVAITAPAGDTGYVSNPGYAYYPAGLQFVTAVGGTTLTPAPGTARGWSETAWGPATENDGTASGCSEYDPKPSWETDTGCAYRTYNDVSAVADPNTGVAIYDTQGSAGWEVAGGTTVSASIVGAVYALAGPSAPGTFPASYPWLHPADLYNVTSGNNFDGGTCTPAYLCNATAGYNGPTGWGTPDGTGAFALGSISGNLISAINPGEQSSSAAEAVSDGPVQALDSAGPSESLRYAATGLPAGLSINASTGVVSGTPTTDCSCEVTVTVSDATGAHAAVTFEWQITTEIILDSPGRQQGEPDSAVSLQIRGNDIPPVLTPTLTYSASGLPPGLSINSTGLITGTTGPHIANYDVTVSATDSAGTTDSFSFTWVIENLITVSVAGLNGDGQELLTYGKPVSLQVSATDSGGDLPLTFNAAALPVGLSINSQTGLITGTPALVERSLVVITVTDSTGSSATVGTGGVLVWFVSGPITVSGPANMTDAVGAVAYFSLVMTYEPGDSGFTYDVTGLPPGVTSSTISPLIEGYPTTPGSYTVSVTVTDPFGGFATTSFTWTVNRRTYYWSRRIPQVR